MKDKIISFLVYGLAIVVIILLLTTTTTTNMYDNEKFGALQSLYSNDGPQDAYLTIENDPNLFYDPYGYWRGVTWDLPTRNLNVVTYYPYLYERQIDRYGTLSPYWSL